MVTVFLLGILTYLVFAGGGLDGGVRVSAAGLTLVLVLQRKSSPWNASRVTWYSSLVALIFILSTLMPWPILLMPELRATFFRRAHEAVTLSEDVMDAPAQGGVSFTEEDTSVSMKRQRKVVLGRLSFNAAGTLRFLFLTVSIWAAFWLVVGLPFPFRSRLVQVIVLGAGCIAVLGILGQVVFPQGKKLLWLIAVPHGKSMGPFVNRNHFAFFCAILSPFALLLTVRPHGPHRWTIRDDAAASEGQRPPAPGNAVGLLRIVIYGMCFAALVAGAFFSLSRGGILTLVIGVGATSALLVKSRPLAATVASMLGMAVVLALLLWPSESSRERIDSLRDATETASAQTRFQMWSDALRIWRRFPVAGAGFGAFRTVYPAYKTSDSRKGALHAENEYVQILAEGGGIGTILVVLVTGSIWCSIIYARLGGRVSLLKSRRRFTGPSAAICASQPCTSGVFLPAAAGMWVAMAANWMVDFGARIPLNAVLLGILTAVAVPFSQTMGKSALDAQKNVDEWQRRIVSVLGVIVLTLVLVFGADAYRLDRNGYLGQCSLAKLRKAVQWAPAYWLPWYELGRRLINDDIVRYADGGKLGPVSEAGISMMRQAGAYNPNNYKVWRVLAKTEYGLGNVERADRAARHVVDLRPWLTSEMSNYRSE
ncbi:MAG: O-antigen ligase family protein [Candidatus Pacebacteria bacterium]|nr:O-antigen ligase family protein [Candidatus Paceibacterota bacterium]